MAGDKRAEVVGIAGQHDRLGDGECLCCDEVLSLLGNLPRLATASHDEVLAFVEAHTLWSRGLSLVDAHLLAALHLTAGISIWTRDQRLHEAADKLGLADDDRR